MNYCVYIHAGNIGLPKNDYYILHQEVTFMARRKIAAQIQKGGGNNPYERQKEEKLKKKEKSVY